MDLADSLDELDQSSFIERFGEEAWTAFQSTGNIPQEIMDNLESY